MEGNFYNKLLKGNSRGKLQKTLDFIKADSAELHAAEFDK